MLPISGSFDGPGGRDGVEEPAAAFLIVVTTAAAHINRSSATTTTSEIKAGDKAVNISITIVCMCVCEAVSTMSNNMLCYAMLWRQHL
jgi:hypothetical protein